MDLTSFISLIKGAPTETVGLISTVAALTALILKWKEADVVGITSIGKLQQDHLKSLMEQNKQLADSLAEIHQQLEDTFAQLREMNKKVVDLEATVQRYRTKCESCLTTKELTWQ